MHPKTLNESVSHACGDGCGTLLTGGVAAILASTCCLGPLVLLALGFSGAWIGNLTALEPYRPVFIAVAVVSLLLAWRRIWRPVATCPRGAGCAVPPRKWRYKLLFVIVAALVLIALTVPTIAPWFY